MSSQESIYEPDLATIKKIRDLSATEKLFEIRLDHGKPLGHKPGQFVEVSVFGVGEAPISLASAPDSGNSTFELGIRAAGNVTNAIHKMAPGSKIGIRGPFGTNFPVEEAKGRDLLFVTGGIGLIPVRSFINHAIANRSDYGRIIILFGARSPNERIFTDELDKWNKDESIEYHETFDRADKSWKGNVGVITKLFPKFEIDPGNTTAMIVGPPIMYRFVIIECQSKGMSEDDINVSLERRMKCGVGKCGHCQINNVYVCQEGAVFKYSDIMKQNLKEAI